jgi:hypothetical protein
MKVWSILPESVYLKLMENDILICDRLEYTDIEFRRAYHWMRNQMNKRLETAYRDRFPLWVWIHHGTKSGKPDLRESHLGIKGSINYCVEFDIPEKDILQSDFSLWHCVLGDWYLASSEEESTEYDTQLKLYGNTPELEHKKIQSWECIFDIGITNDWIGTGTTQGCVWEFKKSEIKNSQRFIAR